MTSLCALRFCCVRSSRSLCANAHSLEVTLVIVFIIWAEEWMFIGHLCLWWTDCFVWGMLWVVVLCYPTQLQRWVDSPKILKWILSQFSSGVLVWFIVLATRVGACILHYLHTHITSKHRSMSDIYIFGYNFGCNWLSCERILVAYLFVCNIIILI